MSIINKVGIIIVTYNSQEYINKCIKSIFEEKIENMSVIVIDNNSTDKTVENINKSKYIGGLKLIISENNLGFAKAVNLGVKILGADINILLNPDLYIKKGSLKKILSYLKKQKNECIVGGKTIGFLNEIQGDHFRKLDFLTAIFDLTNISKFDRKRFFHNKFYYLDEKYTERPLRVYAVTGGFMCIPKKVIKKIGLLDENFFMYLEDVDYCKRAIDKNIPVIYFPESIVYHYGGGSSNNYHRSNLKAWFSSRKYYFIKNGNFLENMILQPLFSIDNLLIKILLKLR